MALPRRRVGVLGGSLALAGALGCAEEPKTGTAGSDDGTVLEGQGGDDSEPANCPAGMVEVEGLSVSLGETDPALLEAYQGQVLEARGYTLDSYCIDQFPFPGRRGDPWPTDELDWDTVEAFAELAEAHGRRLCTVAELLYAGAGLYNWRYPYDADVFVADQCDPSDVTPTAPLGSFPSCTSPLGVQDFMVRSTWGVLDEQSGEQLRAFYETTDGGTLIPGGGVYAVWGGSASQETFYAPNNFGVHFYGPEDPGYINESVRTCAPVGTPPEDVDADWAELQGQFASDPRWAAFLP
jgi:hypothetical protein